MAAGDLTRDTGFPRQMGNMWMLTGTCEVDDTERNFAICDTNSRLIQVQLVDVDGVGTPWQRRLNTNAAGTVTNGTFTVMGNHQSVDTYNYIAFYT